MKTQDHPTYKLSRGCVRVTCVEGVPHSVAARWLSEHDGWFGADNTPAATGAVAAPRAAALTLETGNAFVKSETIPLARSLRYALSGRPARAHRAFRLGLALAERGVASPMPLALIEHRHRGLVRRSVLVLETIHANNLRHFLLGPLGALPEVPRHLLKERLWKALSREVAKLHCASFRQRDLKAPNILVAEDDAGALQVHLVDLDGMSRLEKQPAPRVRIRDLARLLVSLREEHVAATGISAEDWRVLVELYLEACSGVAPRGEEVELFVRQSTRWARRKERRNRRRRRPLS